jgi:hypothetical protein
MATGVWQGRDDRGYRVAAEIAVAIMVRSDEVVPTDRIVFEFFGDAVGRIDAELLRLNLSRVQALALVGRSKLGDTTLPVVRVLDAAWADEFYAGLSPMVSFAVDDAVKRFRLLRLATAGGSLDDHLRAVCLIG